MFCAEVAKLVDAVDSKSSARNSVSVQIRPSAPILKLNIEFRMRKVVFAMSASLDGFINDADGAIN